MTSAVGSPHLDSNLSQRELFLEQRLRQIEEQFQSFQQALGKQKQTAKGKGRGKKSKNYQTEIEEEAQRRLRQFLASQQINPNPTESEDGSFQPTSSQNLPSTSERFQTCSRFSDNGSTTNSIQQSSSTTKQIYIKKIEITINGTPVLYLAILLANK